MVNIPYGVMFHHFYDGTQATGQGAITPDELQKIIDFCGKDNLISAQEWMARSERDALEPHHICLTFDDALLCQYEIALPVLEANGLTAFWFVYSSVFNGHPERLESFRYFRVTQFPDVEEFYQQFEKLVMESDHSKTAHDQLSDFLPSRYLTAYPFYTDSDRRFRFIRNEILGEANYNQLMDRMLLDFGVDRNSLLDVLWMNNDQLKRLHENGHVIGLHSYSHPISLERLEAEEQQDEYNKNAAHLEQVLGVQATSMSHPTNSYGPETLRILQDMGVTVGFRADMAMTDGSNLEYCRKDHATIMMELQSQ